MISRNNRSLCVSLLALFCTFGVIWSIRSSIAISCVLPVCWYFLFRPLVRQEVLVFLVAGVFIVLQNYSVLRTGAFSFLRQDFLLMPYYEPLLWGFYFLSLKRFFLADREVSLEWPAFLGLGFVSIAFGMFASTGWLSAAVFVATAGVLFLFHSREDLAYAAYTLTLGFVVEFFGVSSGEWAYPDPDFLGIPFWFAPMWISVGLLGRRLLFPLVAVLDRNISRFLG